MNVCNGAKDWAFFKEFSGGNLMLVPILKSVLVIGRRTLKNKNLLR